MNGDHDLNKELEQLLLDLLDGGWNADKQQRLDELLRDDEAARARYRELMAMHAMLDAEFCGALNLNDDIVAAAVVVASVGVWAFFLKDDHRDDRPVVGSHPGDISRPDTGSAPKDTVIAVVTRVLRPQWAEGAGAVRPGQLLGKQWIRLETGIVQIEFRSGACVTLEGPGHLRLDSETGCFVRAGKLTVLAPPDAANFTVKSPAVEVVDLGTEFGLVVDESGKLDVHVLNGQIEAAAKGAEGRPITRQKLVDTMTRPQGNTRGVFDTALGRDAINPGSSGGNVRNTPMQEVRVPLLCYRRDAFSENSVFHTFCKQRRGTRTSVAGPESTRNPDEPKFSR